MIVYKIKIQNMNCNFKNKNYLIIYTFKNETLNEKALDNVSRGRGPSKRKLIKAFIKNDEKKRHSINNSVGFSIECKPI